MTCDFVYTKSDLARTLELQSRLQDEGKEFFSSDDFRNYGLDAVYDHPETEVGTYFAKLKYWKLAEPVGEIPSEIMSNHRRKNDLWRWTTKGLDEQYLRKLARNLEDTIFHSVLQK